MRVALEFVRGRISIAIFVAWGKTISVCTVQFLFGARGTVAEPPTPFPANTKFQYVKRSRLCDNRHKVRQTCIVSTVNMLGNFAEDDRLVSHDKISE